VVAVILSRPGVVSISLSRAVVRGSVDGPETGIHVVCVQQNVYAYPKNTFHIRFEAEIIVQRFELFMHQNVPTELAGHDAFLSIASVRHDRPIMI